MELDNPMLSTTALPTIVGVVDHNGGARDSIGIDARRTKDYALARWLVLFITVDFHVDFCVAVRVFHVGERK